LQVVLDGATINEDSTDLYGNVIIIMSLENDPIYHHCHLQIKRKSWLTTWEPTLYKLLFPEKCTTRTPKKAVLESPRKARQKSATFESPLKVSPASSLKNSTGTSPIRPRSKSIEAKPIEGSSTRQSKKQRRKSEHPNIVKEKPLILEPMIFSHIELNNSNPDIRSSPRSDDANANNIFEAGVEIPNKEVDIFDVYNLLQNLYKEILMMKKDVRQMKVDLATLKEAQKKQ